MMHNGKHAAKEEEVACLQCLNVATERCRRFRELNAQFLQPTLCPARPRNVRGYHLLRCARSSRCSTSAVTMTVFSLAIVISNFTIGILGHLTADVIGPSMSANTI
jgi:hypothetical protein